MNRIIHSADQQELAQAIRNELAAVPPPPQPLLIVLVSAQSNSDPAVQSEIRRAQEQQQRIIPILAENVALPPGLAGAKPLNFAGGYQPQMLLKRLSQAAMTREDIQKANRRALLVIGLIALLMFVLSMAAMSAGLIAFPVAEYNEEATFQAQWINGMIVETLEFVQPRSTADAVGFDATLQAAPTRLYLYIRETATALPRAPED